MKAGYHVEIDARVARELRRIPEKDADRIIAAIEALAENPRPRNARKLVGEPGWRIRIGNYRVLYQILDTQRMVRVFRAGNRREIYRD